MGLLLFHHQFIKYKEPKTYLKSEFVVSTIKIQSLGRTFLDWSSPFFHKVKNFATAAKDHGRLKNWLLAY